MALYNIGYLQVLHLLNFSKAHFPCQQVKSSVYHLDLIYTSCKCVHSLNRDENIHRIPSVIKVAAFQVGSILPGVKQLCQFHISTKYTIPTKYTISTKYTIPTEFTIPHICLLLKLSMELFKVNQVCCVQWHSEL